MEVKEKKVQYDVECANCGAYVSVAENTDVCPECGTKGSLIWRLED